MRSAKVVFALLLVSAAAACAQGELAPSTDSGPMKKSLETPQTEKPSIPVPDSKGVYSLDPEMTLPAILHWPQAAARDDVPDCDPRVVIVEAVIDVNGRAEIRGTFTPRTSPCANLAILAIKQSEFQPATWNKSPVPVRLCVRVSFEQGVEPSPSVGRCPRPGVSYQESDSGYVSTEPTPIAPGKGVMMPATGPTDALAIAPVPDEHGVYSLGPGITPPKLETNVEASPADAVAACRHPSVVSAVLGTDGKLKVVGVYRLFETEERACDNMAVAAIEQSKMRPATWNGEAVPVHVCLGIPFGRPYPPVPRTTVCPRNVGARPLGNGNAFELPPGVKPPVVISYPPPAEYSPEARRKRIEGIVKISMVVNEEGLPTDLQVVKGLGYRLDDNALDSARQYRFQPATKDGNAVPARITIEVNFRLGNRE